MNVCGLARLRATSAVFAKVNRNIHHRIPLGRADADAADTFWAPQAIRSSALPHLRWVREIGAKLLAVVLHNINHATRRFIAFDITERRGDSSYG